MTYSLHRGAELDLAEAARFYRREGGRAVVDESGEDYLYPAKWFAELKLPQEVQESLMHVA